MYPLRYTLKTAYKAYSKLMSICFFLKLLKVEKRIKGITAYPRIQLFQGYSRGTQRGYSLKPLNISIVERILVFKR